MSKIFMGSTLVCQNPVWTPFYFDTKEKKAYAGDREISREEALKSGLGPEFKEKFKYYGEV